MTRRYNMAMRLWLTGLGVIFSGLFVWTATVEAGYRGPFEGRVIDAETRQPIQGAVVFMEWSLGTPTAAGRVDEFYDAAEVLTDKNGYFSIEKKSSWNPWTNWMLEARGLIYKAGYGAATNLGTPWLRARAVSQKGRTEEERRKLGPDFYFDIEFDNDLPVFLLRKLTTAEERIRNTPSTRAGVPHEMKTSLMKEINDERTSLGYGEVTD
jgi:hypothetical protein